MLVVAPLPGSVRAFNGRGHCRVRLAWEPMRCSAWPNACTEAAAVTDSCGRSGSGGRGRRLGSCSGQPSSVDAHHPERARRTCR